MEILIADATIAGLEGDPAVWQASLRTELSTFDQNVHLEESDIGPGADWPMVLAIFSGIGSVFILGEKIEKNLDAWIRLARRFRTLIARLQERFTVKRIDPLGGSLLALGYVGQEETVIRSIELVAAAVIPISPFPGRDPARIDSRVNALYVQAFKINDESIYLFGITSNGEVDFVKKYGATWENFRPPGT